MMELAERLLSKSASVRATYCFNAAGAFMNALTMLGIQMLSTRILGAAWAGMISADTAAVLLCYHLAQLNMRPYQCTDVKRTFSFSEYLTLKTIMVSVMTVLSLFYVFFRREEPQRLLFTLSLCAYKGLESFSDCFWGMFQERGRLDLAGLGMAVYELLGLTFFAAALLITRQPGWAALLMAVLGLLHLLFFTVPIGRRLDSVKLVNHRRRILLLFSILVPLFAAGYFMNIAITLPKYALEMSRGEEALGIFAAVYMPAQGILLASNFFFQPRLRTLAKLASENRTEEFRRLLFRLTAVTAALDLAVMAPAYLFGIPVLSALFRLDLSAHRRDLLLILAGGGFFALYTLFSNALIAMRREKGMAVLALICLGISAVLCFGLTKQAGIRGASESYFFSMLIAALLFFAKIMHASSNPGKEDYSHD